MPYSGNRLDGIARAYSNIEAAMQPSGDLARENLMAAAFAGGAAIHKGLGPAHAIALSCGDQNLHHGVLVAAALPLTLSVVLPRVPRKAGHISRAMGLGPSADIPSAIAHLMESLGLPQNYRDAGYKLVSLEQLVDLMLTSPFNRTTPYVPSRAEYTSIAIALALPK